MIFSVLALLYRGEDLAAAPGKLLWTIVQFYGAKFKGTLISLL